ncbi:hypothetical protein MRB53_031594 [Persea americana]|uniref:Uncharacterized protein n=1 Tax=Persea americana TaxID=3435 RepID=A0ACC2KPW6_PERAE|nr:hypothetical protein MRB53_031594 [Persea americana]
MSRKSSSALEWKFSQVLGERIPGEEVLDVDITSAIEFDKSGKYLATGDNGGRIVLFEQTNEKDDLPRKVLEHSDCCSSTTHPEYRYKTEFQSHEPEFDYLKSLEIGEKINNVRWCVTPNDSLFVLSANDRTIKLWKVLERKVKKVKEMKPNPSPCSENAILAERSFVDAQNDSSFSNGYHQEWKTKLPENSPPSSQGGLAMISKIEACSARCRRVYARTHYYNINSISNNSDGETYLSADDLRINLWNLEIGDQCFNIIDMEPSDMEDLTEVITSAEFHPVYCNLLAYGSSRGFIRLVDLRQSALCDWSARILQDHEVHGSRTLLTEIIASISNIKFLSDGRHMLSRDYMNLKLWDLRMEASPVEIFKIHEYLRPKLCDLYNSDSIFDKFGCCLTQDGLYFATGSYSNLFRIFSRGAGSEGGITLEASKIPNRFLQTAPKVARTLSNFTRGHSRRGHDILNSENAGFPCDLNTKLLHLAWHPTTTLIACAAANSLYMYYV